MILGVNPEDGDGGNAVIARHLLRELDRRHRFEQGEQRAAEETGLLTADDGDGPAIGQQTAGLARLRRRLAAFLLAGNHGGDLVAAAVVGLRACDRIGPRGAVGRIAGEKRRDGAEIVRVVRRQADEIHGKRRTSTGIRTEDSEEASAEFNGTGRLLSQSVARTVKPTAALFA